MIYLNKRLCSVVWLCVLSGICAPTASLATVTPPAPARISGRPEAGTATVESAALTLGGKLIFRLATTAAGEDPQSRVDSITDRLTTLLAQPDLTPSDVVLYLMPGQDPTIYVLGHRIVAVDKSSAKLSGIGTPLQTAVVWAKRLQQILPLVDIRLMNESEPNVPANPPLLITKDFGDVGGAVGEVYWNKHLIISLTASPVANETAAEYADAISDRLATELDNAGPGPVIVSIKLEGGNQSSSVDVLVNSMRLITATRAEAKAIGIDTPTVLAMIWAGNLQRAIDQDTSATPGAG